MFITCQGDPAEATHCGVYNQGDTVMAKVNLNEIKDQLSSRGRAPYENPELLAEMKALDPEVDGDAFICEISQGDPTSEDYTNHKAMWRGRAETLAEKAGIDISVQGLSTGLMVVSLAKRKARKRK